MVTDAFAGTTTESNVMTCVPCDCTPGMTFIQRDDGVSYRVGNSAGATGTLVIPQYFCGLPVTAIGSSALEGCTGLDGTLSMPSSMRTIGQEAFITCTDLSALSLEPGVTSIGRSAFADCGSLMGTLTIPSTVTELGIEAFRNAEFGIVNRVEPPTTVTDYMILEDCPLSAIKVPASAVDTNKTEARGQDWSRYAAYIITQ